MLCLVCVGTANDLCTGLEIPTDPREALEVALGSNDGYPIDLGMVNDQVQYTLLWLTSTPPCTAYHATLLAVAA